MRLVVGVQFLMKHYYHQSLSAEGIELPLLPTLMGNPYRDRLPHLIKCSEPCRQIICTRGTTKNLLFKTEPGQFILWLSRQWNASNPYENCATVGHKITPWGWEHAYSACWSKDGAPCERWVWHLIFLNMKDDDAVAGANLCSDGEKCLKLNLLPFVWRTPGIQRSNMAVF